MTKLMGQLTVFNPLLCYFRKKFQPECVAQQYIILCLILLPSQFIEIKKKKNRGENSKDQDLKRQEHKLVANVYSVWMRINRKYLTLKGVAAI